MSKIKYPGILDEPMVWHSPKNMAGALLGYKLTKDKETADNQNRAQLTERLKALYEHFNINPGDKDSEFSMLVALASAHVPGFKWKDDSKRKAGRPSKWRGEKSAELYADVKFLMSSGHTASGACRVLADSPKYAERYQGEKHKNLYRRYQEAPQNMDSHLRTMMTIEKSKGAPFDQWMIELYSLCGKC